jgi:AmiR/NasT family two-component response regulator
VIRLDHHPLPDVESMPAVRWPDPTDLRAEVVATALIASPVATRQYIEALKLALDRAHSSDELVGELYQAGVIAGQKRAAEAAGLLWSTADAIRASLSEAEEVAR